MAVKRPKHRDGKGTRKRAPAKDSSIQLVHPHAAGIDIGSRFHWVAVPAGLCDKPVREFAAFTPDLHALADWLVELGITTVAMEATGVYWLPLYEILEERGIEVCLVNATHAHNVPGRKSDILDCQWLQQLHSFGLLRASFRPTAEIARLRAYLRQRDNLVQSSTREVQHMQKALTLMNLQLHLVIADITGLTGMHILRAIVAGERDPEVLAAHRHPRCRCSHDTLVRALTGNYQPEHLFALHQALALYDKHLELIAQCDAEVDKLLSVLAPKTDPDGAPRRKKCPHAKQPKIELAGAIQRLTDVDLTEIPGIADYTAAALISEIGLDMGRWPDAKHFTSWLRLAPGTRITGGKKLRTQRLPGHNRAAQLLRMAAQTAGRTQTALGAFYRSLAARKDKPRATVATAAKLARIIYTVLKHRTAYQELGLAQYEQRHKERTLRNLRRKAAALGLQLVPNTPPSPEEVGVT